MNIFGADDWLWTSAGAVESDLRRKVVALLESLPKYFEEKGFTAKFSLGRKHVGEFLTKTIETRILRLKRDGEDLFRIYDRYDPSVGAFGYWCGWVSPWYDLGIRRFNFSENSIEALNCLLSNSEVERLHGLYVRFPPREVPYKRKK